MGIYVTKEDDPQLYRDIHNEVTSLIRTSNLIEIPIEKVEPKKAFHKKKFSEGKDGYCIRCDTKIKLNLEHPLCAKCYKNWSKYSDSTYEEKFCHICGKENKSSLEKPVCYSCYKESK